ncbi:MAG: hypothetical protein WC441_05360 [Patescibacteria group bacterium]
MDNKYKKPLRILLDSDYLKSDVAKRLLNYFDNELFEFVSLGSSKMHTVVQLSLGGKNDISGIVIDKLDDKLHGYKESTMFGYKISDIKIIAESLDIKYDDLILTFILKTLLGVSEDKKVILITERKKLLSRLNWARNGFPELPAHSILSPEEAMIFIDLYCKNKNKFLIAPNYYVNRGLWYLYSLKTKVKNYKKVWSISVYGQKHIPRGDDLMDITASLGDRIIDLLTAIDEIGINYYSGVNNDTQDATIYHFNYLITLFTGVFDSLAWISKYRYQIKFDQFERIGLRKDRQKDFMELLYQKNDKIKDFLSQNSSLINLTYSPRDLIIHRARLKALCFDNRNDNFYFNMIRVPQDFFNHIVALSKENGSELGEWGHYKLDNEYFLEPYRFVKMAAEKLIIFVDGYLNLLSFDGYLKTMPVLSKKLKEGNSSDSHKDFLKQLEIFDKFKLGY